MALRTVFLLALLFSAPALADDTPATKAECEDSCLLLARLSFEEVQKNICTLCKAHDPIACELDWPSSDVPPCGHWDYLRNCIFASHGHVFKGAKWKKAFEKKAWYRAKPGFDPKTLPKVAQDNVQRLLRYKKTKHMCISD